VSHTLVVKQRLTTGLEELVVTQLQALAQASRLEKGNVRYEVLRGTEDPNTVIIIEEWADLAAFEAHVETPHIRQFQSETSGLLEIVSLDVADALFPGTEPRQHGK
jgi:quinol monooxygenase YgiN